MTTNSTEFQDTPIGKIPADWRVTDLENIADFITKGATPTTYGFDWVQHDIGIPFLRSECVTTNGFNPKGMNYISDNAHHALERSCVISGDLLMTITGNIGRVAMLPASIPEANINQHIARIRVSSSQCEPSFVLHSLKRDEYADYYGRILTGQAYPQISLTQVRSTHLPLPSLGEQKKIARILSCVDSKLALIDQQITTTQTLKKGLMQKLFTQGVGTQDADGRWQPHTEFQETELGLLPTSWDLKRLDEIASVARGRFSARPRNDPKFFGGNCPFVQTGDISASKLFLEAFSQTLNEKGISVSKS